MLLWKKQQNNEQLIDTTTDIINDTKPPLENDFANLNQIDGKDRSHMDKKNDLESSTVRYIEYKDQPKCATGVNENKKMYICYTFDNLNDDKDSNVSSVLTNAMDSPISVFKDLEDFVGIVIATLDPNEVIILIKISSPGGVAYKFELAYSHLMRLNKMGFKLIALIDDMCASGGYMLASACNEIYCSEYANIGSVGVVASFHNYHDLLQKIGVVEKVFTTGPYKRPFPAGEKFDEEHIKRVNEEIEETLIVFSEIVQKSRKLSNEEMKEILSAKMWYGKKAYEKKLVDGIVSSGDYLNKLSHNKNKIYIVERQDARQKSKLESLLNLSYLIAPLINSFLKNNIHANNDRMSIMV